MFIRTLPSSYFLLEWVLKGGSIKAGIVLFILVSVLYPFTLVIWYVVGIK